MLVNGSPVSVAIERNMIASTVIGAGVTVFEALKAYDKLKAEGTSIRVIDLYSVAPVDAAGLTSAARATGGATDPDRRA